MFAPEVRFTEGAVMKLPLLVAVFDDARLDLVLEGETRQFFRRYSGIEGGQRIPDQEGFALPVLGQEVLSIESQLQWPGHALYSMACAWLTALPM